MNNALKTLLSILATLLEWIAVFLQTLAQLPLWGAKQLREITGEEP